MCNSAVILSMATISAVIAVACLGISFGTDNWYEVRVDRQRIRSVLNPTGQKAFLEKLDNNKLYFDRDIGLWRECFPNEKPKSFETYISPVETDCINLNYHIPEDEALNTYNDDQWARLHMARSMVALFIVAFFFIIVSFFTGVTGCWKRSPGSITTTGIIMLIAALFSAGGMGLWHGVDYYERIKLGDTEYYQAWDMILKNNVDLYFGWSYILSWIGVGWCFMASIMFLVAARRLRHEKRKEQAKNMQYLMPVYPDKRQPPYAGYNYAYPGPYYQHGPYNY